MAFRKLAAIVVIAMMAAPVVLMARQGVLKNGSLEFGPGPVSEDPHNPASWITFGPTVERSDQANLDPNGAGHALKAFSSDPQVGAYQDVPVAPGANVTISASLYTLGSDKLTGDAQAWIALEFYDPNDQFLTSYPLSVLNASSPADTWVFGSEGPHAAPALTAYARMVCVWTWNGSATGSAYWDNCRLTVNGGANLLANGNFETAGVGQQSPFGIDDWTGFEDQQKSSDVAKDGTYSVLLGTTAAYSGLFQNMGILASGDHLYMRAYVWSPASDPLTGNSRAGLKLEFDPATGNAPPPEENLAFAQSNPDDTWTLVQLSTIVPTDVTVAKVVCIFNSNAQTTGSVFFDAAWAERGTAPGTNQLANASFEAGPGGANGISNWTEFGAGGATTRKSIFEVPAFDLSYTAKSTGPSTTGISQEITVQPGETFTFRTYLYTPSFDPLTGSGNAGVKVEWKLGTLPLDVDLSQAPNNTIYGGASTDTWIPVEIDYTMPAGTNALTRFVNLIERGTATSGRVYFDACDAVVLNKFNGADSDADDDEDLLDYAQFQHCFTGSTGTLNWGCLVFDSDDDQNIDTVDFNYFAPRMTGPHQ